MEGHFQRWRSIHRPVCLNLSPEENDPLPSETRSSPCPSPPAPASPLANPLTPCSLPCSLPLSFLTRPMPKSWANITAGYMTGYDAKPRSSYLSLYPGGTRGDVKNEQGRRNGKEGRRVRVMSTMATDGFELRLPRPIQLDQTLDWLLKSSRWRVDGEGRKNENYSYGVFT